MQNIKALQFDTYKALQFDTGDGTDTQAFSAFVIPKHFQTWADEKQLVCETSPPTVVPRIMLTPGGCRSKVFAKPIKQQF